MNQDMNWGYKTVPQAHCDGREIDYSRGKGLGGSTSINFGVYTRGARDDYEEWCRMVDDPAFKWEQVKARFKALEDFQNNLPNNFNSKYAAPDPQDHGNSGPLKVGYAADLEKDLLPLLDIFEDAGFPLNPDHNSGNPIGMSVLINSSRNGLRSTANDLLTPVPGDLTIVTSSPVSKVLLEGETAVGVETYGGKKCENPVPPSIPRQHANASPADFASKEVILSAGSLDNPKILMHSGLGPRPQLEKFDIPVVKDIPAIGQGLRDHMFCPLVHTRKEGDTDRASFYSDEKKMEQALEQWKKDGTGPWAKFACELGIGWFKLPRLVASEEFRSLPEAEKAYLNRETVPHYEIITHFPIHWFMPGFPSENLNYSCLLVFYDNAQSRGEVTLQSADPAIPLKFDPRFLSEPFDRRAAIESLREALRIVKHEGYAKNSVAMMAGPADDSDDALLAYWKQTISSSWHMSGTVKMGKPGEEDAVVDSDFRVMGIRNLRVADMSVVPVLVSGHTQAAAYMTGIICAEKIVK